jgi:hypothetical protein
MARDAAFSGAGMAHVFDEARCAVHIVKFGRFSADVLAFAAADGSIYIASTTKPAGILQVRRVSIQGMHLQLIRQPSNRHHLPLLEGGATFLCIIPLCVVLQGLVKVWHGWRLVENVVGESLSMEEVQCYVCP